MTDRARWPKLRGTRGRSTGLLIALSLLVGSPLVSIAAPARKKKEPQPRPSGVYVFYSEPPFAYTTISPIRVRLLTLWDRERKEKEIRKEVAKAGADMVILERSFLENDGTWFETRELDRRGSVPVVRVPTRSAYVAGRLGRRLEAAPPPAAVRFYRADFETVWSAVTHAVTDRGWPVEKIDTDSRYLTTRPVVSAASTMTCDDGTSTWLPAVFRVHVNTFAGESMVRLDVAFVDRTSGAPAACRSAGVYEAAFFRDLDRALEGARN